MANEFKVKNGIIVNTSTNTQAKLAYDETHYTTLNVDANGDLTIDPTGSDVIVDGYTTATGFKIPGGTSSQYLRADGTTGAGGTGGASELGPDIQRCGFLNQTETTISFDGTNTFTLGDAGSGWAYYMDGEKYSITGNKTVTLAGSPPAAKGRYFITITNNGSGTLSSSTTVWNLLDSTVLPVAIVNWDNALTPKYWLADERHSCLIDRRDHYLQHHSHGTLCLQAGALAGYTLNTSSDAANTFSIGETHLADEDILLTLSALTDPNGSSADYVVFYRNSSNVWSWKSSIVPFSYTTSSYIEWDNAGTLTTGITNKWYNSYILFTDYAGAARFIIVSGRGEFSSLSNAQAEDPALFDWTGLGISEYVIAYQLTWKSATADSNTGKARLIAEPKRINISSVSATGVDGATGIDVSDDYTDGSYYPIWSKASSGNVTDVYTSSGSLTYNPSTSNLALKGTVNAYGTLLGVLFEDETATCQDVDVSLLDTPLTAPSIIKGTSSIVTSYLKNNDPTFDSKLYGMYNKTIIDTTGGNSNNNGYVCGLFSGAEINSSDATYNKLYEGVGGHNYIQVENTADVQIATGVKSSVVAASGGNIETGYLFKGSFGATMGGTIAQRYGIYIDSACNSYLYGLQIGGSVPTNTGTQGLGVGTASTGSGNIDASGTITNIKEWSATTGSAGIYLNGTTGNRIDFASVGSAAPSIPTRSAGCKVMYLNDTTNGDYATGIESGYVWNSIPSTGTGFKWYKGSSATATLTGEGYLTLNGTAPGIKVTNATSTVKTTNTFENTGSSGSSFDIRSHGSGYSETVFGSNVSGDTALITTAGDLLVGTSPAKSLILGTNNTARMTFDSAGSIALLDAAFDSSVKVNSECSHYNSGTLIGTKDTTYFRTPSVDGVLYGYCADFQAYFDFQSTSGYGTSIYGSRSSAIATSSAGYNTSGKGSVYGSLSGATIQCDDSTYKYMFQAVGLRVSATIGGTTSTVTNMYGIASTTAINGGTVTNSYLLSANRVGNATNNYGLHITTTDINYVAGGMQIGGTIATGTSSAGLGVGTAASGVTGEIRATSTITASYSDKRLKNIISTIPDALDKVCSLSGYYYTENKKAKELGYTNDRVQVGLVTQEVEKVLPEIVTDAPIGHGYKTLWYEKMVPVLVEAIKEQQGIIEKQDERIERLEMLVAQLMERRDA